MQHDFLLVCGQENYLFLLRIFLPIFKLERKKQLDSFAFQASLYYHWLIWKICEEQYIPIYFELVLVLIWCSTEISLCFELFLLLVWCLTKARSSKSITVDYCWYVKKNFITFSYMNILPSWNGLQLKQDQVKVSSLTPTDMTL